MDLNVQKEISTIKQMVQCWYDFYLGCANGHKYDQIHVEEFEEVINEQLSPYLQRLSQCKYLTRAELRDLYLYIATMRNDLSSEIAKVKPEEKEDPIIILLRNLNLTKDQKKAVAEYLKS